MSLKLTHYKVVSEPINQAGKRIVFSTRSNRSAVLTQGCIDYLVDGRISEVPEKTVKQLVDMKILVPSNEDELLTIVTENKNEINNVTTLYEVIQPSANCQLGCYYCGQKHAKHQMGPELYIAVEARIRHKASTGKFNALSIGWFGAEPLMGLRQIRELTAILKQIASDYNMSYSAKVVTNGLSLKEGVFDELVRDLSVNRIEVTLDGTAEFHDSHRYTKENGSSFDLIYQNLKTIFSKPDFGSYGCAVTIRCNVDKKNFEGVTPLINLIAESQLQRKMTSFYPIGVYSWGNDAHKNSLTKEEFAEKELVWIVQKIKKNFRISSLMPSRVRQVCFAVSSSSELFDAYGNIFDCSEVSYVPVYEKSKHVMGNLSDNPVAELKRSHLLDWNDTILTDKFPCHTCQMLPVCGGACPKSWHEDMRACPPNKFNITDKLLINYVMNQPTVEESKNKYLELAKLYPDKPWIKEFDGVYSELQDKNLLVNP